MTDAKDEVEMKYYAFISYSHQDKEWGDWLHKALETYKVPRALVGQMGRDGAVPKRPYPVFRDREELPTSADLGENIGQALRASRYLIVICSPRSAQSQWVNEEIRSFKAMGRANRVLCLIVDGEPNTDDPETEAFPDAVKFIVDDDGKLTDERAEPIAADARAHADGKESAKLKLLAGLLGVDFDKLAQRDKKRKQRQRLIAGVAGLALLTAGGFAVWQTRSADIKRQVSEADTAARNAVALYQEDRVMDAMAELTKAVPDALVNAGRVPDAAKSALYQIMATNHVVAEVPIGDAGFFDLTYDAATNYVLLDYGYGLQVHDAKTLQNLYRVDVPARLRTFHIDHAKGRLILLYGGERVADALDRGMIVAIFDLQTGALITTHQTRFVSRADPIYHNGRLYGVTLSEDEAGDPVSSITSWQIDSDMVPREEAVVHAQINDLSSYIQLHADGKIVSAITDENRLVLFDVTSGQNLASYKNDDNLFSQTVDVAVSADGARAIVNRVGGNIDLIDLGAGTVQTVGKGIEGCVEDDAPLSHWVDSLNDGAFVVQNCFGYGNTFFPTSTLLQVDRDGTVTPLVEITSKVFDLWDDGLVMLLNHGSDGVWRTAGLGPDKRDVTITSSDLEGVMDAAFVGNANSIITLHRKGVLRRIQVQDMYQFAGQLTHDGEAVGANFGLINDAGTAALIRRFDNSMQLLSFADSDKGAIVQGKPLPIDMPRYLPSDYVMPIMGDAYWAVLLERQDDYGRKILIGDVRGESTNHVTAVKSVDWMAASGSGQHLLLRGQDAVGPQDYFMPMHLFVVDQTGQISDSTLAIADMPGVLGVAASAAHQTVLTSHLDHSVRFWRVGVDGTLSDPQIIFEGDPYAGAYPEHIPLVSSNQAYGAIIETTDPYAFPGGANQVPDHRVTVVDMENGQVVGSPNLTVPRDAMALSNIYAVEVMNNGKGVIGPFTVGMNAQAVVIKTDGTLMRLETSDGVGVGIGHQVTDRHYLSDAGDVFDLQANKFVTRDLLSNMGLMAASPFWVDGTGGAVGVRRAAIPYNGDNSCLTDPATFRALYCVPGTLLIGGAIQDGDQGLTLYTIDFDQVIRYRLPSFETLRQDLMGIIAAHRQNNPGQVAD